MTLVPLCYIMGSLDMRELHILYPERKLKSQRSETKKFASRVFILFNCITKENASPCLFDSPTPHHFLTLQNTCSCKYANWSLVNCTM